MALHALVYNSVLVTADFFYFAMQSHWSVWVLFPVGTRYYDGADWPEN